MVSRDRSPAVPAGTAYDDRPWLSHYPPGRGPSLPNAADSPLAQFYAALDADPDAPAIHYFDATLSRAEVDAAADALAGLLLSRGFAPGDRLALYVQNGPAFLFGLLAAWKIGGVAALLSPMSKSDEFRRAITDLAPTALLSLDDLYEEIARELIVGSTTTITTVVTVSALDFQERDDQRLFAGTRRRLVDDTADLAEVVSLGTAGLAVTAPPRRLPAGDDLAVLASTSGTSGTPKWAMLSHRNLAFTARTYLDWSGLAPGEPILCMSPVFHVTGLVGSLLLGLAAGSPVVLTHRFAAAVVVDAIAQWRPVFTIAAITAYIALAEHPAATPDALAPLRLRFAGGSPLEPDVADRLDERLGGYIHNVYGQTETASPSHMVPPGTRAPVDPETGVMSVGLPVFDTVTEVVDDAGKPVAPGTIGELVTRGPQVAAGYWGDPAESRAALAGGRFRTGDVGFMDADGWFYVVDRSTDLINAAGYKIWPFEVEQVLHGHPAVREAAVVGIADDYRGESTRAYVALHPGATATPAELIDYCRARLAAFKYPREIEIVGSLPRTATGKLLRRRLG